MFPVVFEDGGMCCKNDPADKQVLGEIWQLQTWLYNISLKPGVKKMVFI